MMTNRSSHIPISTEIQIPTSHGMLVRIFFDQRSIGTTTFVVIRSQNAQA